MSGVLMHSAFLCWY